MNFKMMIKRCWHSPAQSRDRIAHVYFGIDLEIVWSTTHEDLPELKPVIQAILDEIQASEEPL